MPWVSTKAPGRGSGRHNLAPLNVLIVDDMPAIRQMLHRMLLKLGIQGRIQEAGDGVEAWEALQAQHYDLVVCDINMPRLNGLDLLRRMRAHPRYETTPFLMITGEVSEDIVAASAESEVDDYLLKPFRVETLDCRLQAILSRHRQPSAGESLFRQAKKLLAGGRPEEALEVLEKLSIPPFRLQARILNLMGECFQALGSFGEAAVCFDQALELNPKYVRPYQNLAALMEAQGNLAAARRYLEEAAGLAPPNAERLYQLGRLCLREGTLSLARRYLAEAWKCGLHPAAPHQAAEVARTFLEAELHQPAEEVLWKALERVPNDMTLICQLAETLRRQQKFPQALACCHQALKEEPQNPEVHFHLGLLYHDLGERDKAREALVKAVQIRPDFPEALDFLQRNFPDQEEPSRKA